MGIKDLNAFVKKYAPSAFKVIPFSSFKNTRIAVDTTLITYASMCAMYTSFIEKEMTHAQLLSLDYQSAIEPNLFSIRAKACDRITSIAHTFISNQMQPIFIFDGVSVDEKNAHAREKRKERRDAIKSKVDALRQQLLDTDPFQRREDDFTALRKLLKQSPPINVERDIAYVREYIEGVIGIRTYTAPDEAEKLCSYLANTGFASAAFTTDTDSYAFGAPLVVQFSQTSWKSFNVVVIPVILRDLNLTHSQFVDLCIMFGCDFNSRIAGVGPEKSWKLISKALLENKTLPHLIEHAVINFNEDVSCLNYIRCREIFKFDDEFKNKVSVINFEIHIQINSKHPKIESALENFNPGEIMDVTFYR